MPAGVRVACCQIAPDVDSPERAPSCALEAIADAVAGGAQIVVLPELVNSGYVFASRRGGAGGGGSRPTASCSRAGRERPRAATRWSSAGSASSAPDGRLYNSSALVDGDGVRAVYRKLHLWGEEPRWFAAGDQPAPVVETRYGRIGLGRLLRHRVPRAHARARARRRRPDRAAGELAARSAPAGRATGPALARRDDRVPEQGVSWPCATGAAPSGASSSRAAA